MAPMFRCAYIDLSSQNIFDKMFEVLIKESTEVKEFLKCHKLASDELKASAILPLVKSFEQKIEVSTEIADMWKWSPVKALKFIESEFETSGFPVSTLKMYIKSNTKEIYEAGKCDAACSLCFASYFTKENRQVLVKKIDREELKEVLQHEEIEHWADIIEEKYIATKQQGDLSEFGDAVKNLTKLKLMQDNIIVLLKTFNPENKTIEYVEVENEDRQFTVSELFEIYAGDYSRVSAAEPEYKLDEYQKYFINQDSGFLEYDEQRQRQIYNFLRRNYAGFYDKLKNAIMSIVRRFQTFDLDKFKYDLNEKYAFSRLYDVPQLKNEILATMINIYKNLQKQSQTTSLSETVEVIFNAYISELLKLKISKNYADYIMEKLCLCKQTDLDIIGVSVYIEKPQTYLTYNRDTAYMIMQLKKENADLKEINEQLLKYSEPLTLEGGASNKKKSVKGGYEKDNFTTKDETFKIYKPESSTGQYLLKLRNLQISYNNKFVEIYREVVAALEAVTQENINKLNSIQAAVIVGQFEKILISTRKTTVYLSGILPTKNYSQEFIKAIVNLTKLCKEIGGCFSHIGDIVAKFEKLGMETLKSYQQIRSDYLESSKDYSEVLINSENINSFTIKCDLKKEDFTRKMDACKRIMAMCNNRSGVKMGSSTGEMLKKYIAGMTDRDKMISEYFDSYSSGIKYILSQTHRSEDLAVIKPLISMKMILVDETKKAYLWLNQYLDKFLVEKRMEQLGKATLDEKTIEKIANAFVEFKKYSKVGLDELVRKYKTFLSSENISNVSVNSYFKLFKLAKQTFEEVDALTYLEKLYNELGITDAEFNWTNFKSKLIGYLVNGMIWFDIYEYNKDSSEFKLMEDITGTYGQHLINHVNPSNVYAVEDSIIPEDIRKYAKNNLKLGEDDLKYRMKKIAEILNLNCEIVEKEIGGKYDNNKNVEYETEKNADFNNVWTKDGKSYIVIDELLEKIGEQNAADKLNQTLGRSDLTAGNIKEKCNADYRLAKKLYDLVTRRPKQGYNEAAEYSFEESEENGKYDINYSNQDKYLYHYTNFGYALKKICMTNANYKMSGAIIGFSMRRLGKVVSLFEGFENYVIESMYTPVLQIIDKYINMRYQGNRDFNLNTNDLLQGGSDEDYKKKAGSIFDIVEPHDPIESEIIIRAIPFYISSYVILNYYARTYCAEEDDDDMQLKLSISKLSPLSDFEKKFTTEHKFILSDEQELKQYVSIMNEYWNSTTANDGKDKLFVAIDHIIAELNSMLIFGNEEKLIRLQESGTDDSHLDIYTINFKKIHDTLVKTINEAVGNIIRKGLNNTAAIENYFDRKIADVREATPNQRIGILKQALMDVYDESKQQANDEYTSFIDLCVSPMYIVDGLYKSVVDLTKYAFNLEFDTSNNTQIIEAHINKIPEFCRIALLSYEKGYKTAGEIVKHVFNEYYRDFDQSLHNIMNFPCLSDGQIKAFLDNVHNNFKSIIESTEKAIAESKNYKAIKDIPYIKNKILIPNVEIQPKIMVKNSIDDTTFTPDTEMFADKRCKSFTQFVVNVLSSLNPTGFLPQYFADALKVTSLANNTFEVMNKPKYTEKENTFNPFKGKCLTTYILCMSTTQTAMTTMESNKMTESLVNKYVSAIPMIIAILTKCAGILKTNDSYKVLIDKRDKENNYMNYQTINAKTEISILIELLSKTYVDILPYSGDIQMLNGGASSNAEHCLTEIRHKLKQGLTFEDFLQQPEKYEWIFERACPELKIRYKDYDRFKDYTAKFAIVLKDITFTKQFNTLLSVIAKNLFNNFFMSINFDIESVGGDFTGRMLGGDVINNVNLILNYNGFPDLKDNNESIVANMLNEEKLTNNDVLCNMFNHIRFIEFLQYLNGKINYQNPDNTAYAAFVQNDYPQLLARASGYDYNKYFDTLSAPQGIIDAVNYINQNPDVRDLLKFACDIPIVKFKVVKDSDYKTECENAIKNAHFDYQKCVSFVIALQERASLNQCGKINSRTSYIDITECLQQVDVPTLINGDREQFKNITQHDVITIPINENNAIGLLKEAKANVEFSCGSPFDNVYQYCRHSSNYLEAFKTFNYTAIIKAWFECMKNNLKGETPLKTEEDFDRMIGEQIKATANVSELSKPVNIVHIGNDAYKNLKFVDLLDFLLNLGVPCDGVSAIKPKSDDQHNFWSCKGFWKLFAVPKFDIDMHAQCISKKFNFNIAFDGVNGINKQLFISKVIGSISMLSGLIPTNVENIDQFLACQGIQNYIFECVLSQLLIYPSRTLKLEANKFNPALYNLAVDYICNDNINKQPYKQIVENILFKYKEVKEILTNPVNVLDIVDKDVSKEDFGYIDEELGDEADLYKYIVGILNQTPDKAILKGEYNKDGKKISNRALYFYKKFMEIYNLINNPGYALVVSNDLNENTKRLINKLIQLCKDCRQETDENFGSIMVAAKYYYKISNIVAEYNEAADSTNDYINTYIVKALGDLVNNFANVDINNKYTGGILDPFLEFSYSFTQSPLRLSILDLINTNLLTVDDSGVELFNKKGEFFSEEVGEIEKSIEKATIVCEGNFAKLRDDSIMVKHMEGGNLEDIDSSSLLKTYAKTDIRFREFLNNADTKLETMIIAYFNKPLLSFNTYFSKNIFVEIIYNSALFQTSLTKIHNNLKGQKNKYWERLIDAAFTNAGKNKNNMPDGSWKSISDIKNADIEPADGSVYGSITQPTVNGKFYNYVPKYMDISDNMYTFINNVQGNGLTTLLLKLDACNEAVGTLAQWIKNFTFTNVEYNDEETFTKYDYEHEPFDY